MAHAQALDDPEHRPVLHGAAAADPEAPARPETRAEVAAAAHAVGASLGDQVVEKIVRALQGAGDAGLTRTELRDTFHRNVPADHINSALELLQRKGRATCATVSTGSGRPPQIWKAAK